MESIEDPSMDDKRVLTAMRKHLAGGNPGSRQRGTLEILLALFASEAGKGEVLVDYELF